MSSKVNIQDSRYKQFMQIVDSIKYFYRHYSFSMNQWGAKLEYERMKHLSVKEQIKIIKSEAEPIKKELLEKFEKMKLPIM